MELSNGRKYHFEPMSNGAKEIIMDDGGDMAEAEWKEYCDGIRSDMLRASVDAQAKRDAMKQSWHDRKAQRELDAHYDRTSGRP